MKSKQQSHVVKGKNETWTEGHKNGQRRLAQYLMGAPFDSPEGVLKILEIVNDVANGDKFV